MKSYSNLAVVYLVVYWCIISANGEKSETSREAATRRHRSFLQRLWEAVWKPDHVYDAENKDVFLKAVVDERQEEISKKEDNSYEDTLWDIKTQDENLTAAQELELRMLKLLGVKELPKPLVSSKVPIYMDWLYRQEIEMGDKSPLSGINVYAHSLLKDSNTIKGELHFNLTSDVDPQTIVSAELALYRYIYNHCFVKRRYTKIPKIDICTKRCITIKVPNMRKLVFDTFDISDIIKDLAMNGVHDLTVRIRMEVIPGMNDTESHLYPHSAPTCFYKIGTEQSVQQPLLLLYHKDPDYKKQSNDKRGKRSHRKIIQKKSNNLGDMNPDWREPAPVNFPDECKMHVWDFDFSTLKWYWWIQPQNSPINFCRGWCHRHPPTRTTHHISSDHAFLVNMYHTQHDLVKRLPKDKGPEHTTCVPETYKPMQILYRVKERDFRKVSLLKLAVESCGCR